jgi:hypothetical protein
VLLVLLDFFVPAFFSACGRSGTGKRRSFGCKDCGGWAAAYMVAGGRGLLAETQQAAGAAESGVGGIEKSVLLVDPTSRYGGELSEAAKDAGEVVYPQLDFDFALRTYFCGHASV